MKLLVFFYIEILEKKKFFFLKFIEIRYLILFVSFLLFQKRDIRIPAREISDEQVKKMKLKYYNSNVHRASFVLPQFIKEVSNIAIILFLSHLSLLNLILSFLSKLKELKERLFFMRKIKYLRICKIIL